MPDLNALVVFAKVVEANSFSKAARILTMPISTVSRRVSELEDSLGVRLLERSTRSLRLTDIGAEIFEHAQRSAELQDAVENIVSNKLSDIAGSIRITSAPSISDTVIMPLTLAFQAAYPNVKIECFVTDRFVDLIMEGIDIALRIGSMKDSSLFARKVLSYREILVASPDYLTKVVPPEKPEDLLQHRLLSFWYGKSLRTWRFHHINGTDRETITFAPSVSMNDFQGLSSALCPGGCIGEVPPLSHLNLVKSGELVEVMPNWRFAPLDLSLVHVSNRHIPQQVRIFKDFATNMIPTMFPDIPK